MDHERIGRGTTEEEIYAKLLKGNRRQIIEGAAREGDPVAKPIQLLSVDENEKFQILPEAAQILRTLNKPIVVISVAGPYRSGKSFLLNLITETTGSGFQVGNTTHACTKGLWIWGEPKDFGEYAVIYIDSEGSRSIDQNLNHDAKLFSVMMLISSIFIYNSLGVIDERAIENLSLAAHLSEHLSCKTEASDSAESDTLKLASISPKFVWVLRDFHLALVDRDNQSIKPKQYMEMVLRRKHCRTANEAQLAETRKAILQLFNTRECFVLPVPVEEDEKLGRLSELTVTELKPKFITQFEKLETWLNSNHETKSILGMSLTGPSLVQILQYYVDAVNSKEMPNVSTSLAHIRDSEYRQVTKTVKEKYLQMRSMTADTLPQEETHLINSLHKAFELSLLELKNVQMRDTAREAEIIEDLEIFFKKDLKFVLDSNLEASKAYNDALVNRLIEPLLKGMKAGKYAQDLQALQHDFKAIGQTYLAEAIGPTKDQGIIKSMRKTQRAAFKQLCKDIIREYGFSVELEEQGIESDKATYHDREAKAEDIRTKKDAYNRQVKNTQADELRVLLDSRAPELKELLEICRDSIDKIK
jgi:hypothetical protein